MRAEENIKLTAFNATAFAFSFSNIENALKILLLLMSIIYTGIMIYKLLKKDNNGTNK